MIVRNFDLRVFWGAGHVNKVCDYVSSCQDSCVDIPRSASDLTGQREHKALEVRFGDARVPARPSVTVHFPSPEITPIWRLAVIGGVL